MSITEDDLGTVEIDILVNPECALPSGYCLECGVVHSCDISIDM